MAIPTTHDVFFAPSRLHRETSSSRLGGFGGTKRREVERRRIRCGFVRNLANDASGRERAEVGKKEFRHSAQTSRTDATMAAHQHNYSSPRLAVRASPTRVKYYIQMRSEAAPVSKAELVKAEGVAVPRGRAAEVEGCKFMEGEGLGGERYPEKNGRTRTEGRSERTQKCRFELSGEYQRKEITSSGLTSPLPSQRFLLAKGEVKGRDARVTA